MNVVVWGLGPHSVKNILPAIQATEGLRLKGVCSRNPSKVEQTAREFKCQGWTDPEKMLSDPGVDIVYLSTPIALHYEQGRSVLQARKHLWCEKPLANAHHQVQELARLSRELKLSLAEGFMYLYHPQFSRLQKLLNEHTGEVRSLICRFGLPPLENPGFRHSLELGGGAFWDVGCYPLSVVSTLYPKKKVEVLFTQIIRPSKNSIDEYGSTFIQVENGPYISLEWGLNCSYRNEIDIWGKKGSVSTERIFSKASEFTPKFRLFDLKGSETVENGESGDHFIAMFHAFRELTNNPEAAEREREKIESRSRLRDQVWNFGKLPKSL